MIRRANDFIWFGRLTLRLSSFLKHDVGIEFSADFISLSESFQQSRHCYQLWSKLMEGTETKNQGEGVNCFFG